MLSYRSTITSTRADGVKDSVVSWVHTDIYSNPYSVVTNTDYGSDGTIDAQVIEDLAYSWDVKLTYHYTGSDFDGNGTYEVESWKRLYYNDGLLSQEVIDSSDWNFDGYPDYQTVVDHAYDEAGRLTSSNWTFLNDGVNWGTDYRYEIRTYTDTGQLDTLRIDDSASQDFEVMWDHNYDAAGRLTDVWFTDPFFGEAPQLKDVYTYDAAGRLATHTQFNVQNEHGVFAEFSEKLTYPGSTHTQRLMEGKTEAGGSVVFRDLHEQWVNKQSGLVTDILVSHDGNLDGKFTPGSKSGYMDGRDREWFKYDADGDVISHKIDHGLNGIDWTYEAVPLPHDDMLIS